MKRLHLRRSLHCGFLVFGMCVLCALPLSARQDADYGRVDELAPETHGAVALFGGLPSVPDLVDAQGLKGEGRDDVEAWWDSWTLGSVDGAKARLEVYLSVSARLFPSLTNRGVTQLLSRNGVSLRTTSSLGEVLATPEFESALTDALHFHDLALSSLQEGDGEVALSFALRSADALRVVSPEQVASGLVKEAQESLRRNEASPSYSDEELTRIRRLTNGAREALEGGDYPRAIRRAYYACQLLGVDPR